MSNVFPTVLLVALPASGKSEVRNFMAQIEGRRLEEEFHIGENLQLDDFPYVHFMRRIDEELVEIGQERVFYPSNAEPFCDNRDWGTLIHLLNEDYKDLHTRTVVRTDDLASYYFDRIDRAAAIVGISPRLGLLDADVRKAIALKLCPEAKKIQESKEVQYALGCEGKTLVIECARGGPDGSAMPLTGADGYQYSFGQLCPEILKEAVILYIWVTPEESRRKNAARENPDDPGSNLFHGTPLPVMLQNYGCDDMPYLLEQTDKPDTITVSAHGNTYHLPIGVFDNRVDKTSFLRADRDEWDPELVKETTAAIRSATDRMWKAYDR